MLENPAVSEMRTISKRKLERTAREKRQKIKLVNLRHPKDLWKGLVTVPAQPREGLGADGCPGTQENLTKLAIKEEENDRGCAEPAKKSWFCKSRGSTTGRGTGNPLISELFLILLISVYGIRGLTAGFTACITIFLSILLQSHTARFCEQ